MAQNKIKTLFFEEETNSPKNEDEETEEKLNYICPESYKECKILEMKDISIFDDNLLQKLEKSPIYSKRKYIDDILKKENSISFYLENLLKHDDTYDILQSLYLDELINELNNKYIKEDKINIIIEKIQKCSIILSQNEYENKIKSIIVKKEELNYINFKNNIIAAFEYILTLQNKYRDRNNVIKAQNILNIRKKFSFGRAPQIGNNNYYFYKLGIRFYDNMVDLFESLDSFDFFHFIRKILEILKQKNLDEILMKNKFKFRYLINLIFDKELIKNDEQYQQACNFIESNDFEICELKKEIKKIKSQQISYEKNSLKYNIDLNESKKTIEYTIKDKTRIGKKNFIKTYKREFNLRFFNKSILEVLNKNLIYFEKDLFTAIKLNEDYCWEYYKPFQKAFNEIIKNILKSQAATKFFNRTYKSKYKDLNYHFNDDNIIKDILERISFAPIFSEKINAYTDPVDLSITLNSIPGKIGDKRTNIYHKKILELGRIILFALHEIMGHFMRRYYSYLTHGKISFETKEDKDLLTGNESGFYFEKEFLGFANPSDKAYLTITDALYLFYWNKYEDYPIVKDNKFTINKNTLENIIANNKDIFNFIGEEDNQINFEDYLIYLTPTNSYNYKRGCIPHEDFIYLNEKFLE